MSVGFFVALRGAEGAGRGEERKENASRRRLAFRVLSVMSADQARSTRSATLLRSLATWAVTIRLAWTPLPRAG